MPCSPAMLRVRAHTPHLVSALLACSKLWELAASNIKNAHVGWKAIVTMCTFATCHGCQTCPSQKPNCNFVMTCNLAQRQIVTCMSSRGLDAGCMNESSCSRCCSSALMKLLCIEARASDRAPLDVLDFTAASRISEKLLPAQCPTLANPLRALAVCEAATC